MDHTHTTAAVTHDAALARIFTVSRGTSPRDLLTNAADDLRLLSTLLELDPNVEIPAAAIRQLLEIIAVVEHVAEQIGGER